MLMDLSKTRIDFANEVWWERECSGRSEEGWERVEVEV
jgi:hypothetical protein